MENVIMILIVCIATIICVAMIGTFFYLTNNKGFTRWKEYKYRVVLFNEKRCVVHYTSPFKTIGAKNVKIDVMEDPISDMVKVKVSGDFERDQMRSVFNLSDGR